MNIMMEERETQFSMEQNISSSLKFGIDRILSSDYRQEKIIDLEFTNQFTNQYCTSMTTESVCAGNCSRCIDYRGFTSRSPLCLSSNYMTLHDKYQHLHRPAPVRPVPRSE